MKRYCDEQGIAMTPYSALASGRLAKHPGETSQRLEKIHMRKVNMMHQVI